MLARVHRDCETIPWNVPSVFIKLRVAHDIEAQYFPSSSMRFISLTVVRIKTPSTLLWHDFEKKSQKISRFIFSLYIAIYMRFETLLIGMEVIESWREERKASAKLQAFCIRPRVHRGRNRPSFERFARKVFTKNLPCAMIGGGGNYASAQLSTFREQVREFDTFRPRTRADAFQSEKRGTFRKRL